MLKRNEEVNRRSFLSRSAKAAGVMVALSHTSTSMAQQASQGITQAMLDERTTKELRKLLHKHGILRVKMKDGSIRRIELSKVEELTYEHEAEE